MRLLVLWLCLVLAIIPSARVISVSAAPQVAAPLPFPITHEGHFGGHVRIVKVEGQTGYLAEGNYFTILDLRALPQIAPLASLPLTGNVYDIAIAGSRAYLGVENVGLVVVDIANLRQPTVIATVPLSDAGTPDDVEVAGTVVYLRTQGDGVRIYDLQTPSAPELLGHYAAPFSLMESGRTLARYGTTLYALTKTSGSQGVHVIDASNPRAPSLVRIIPAPDSSRLANAVTISDGRLYVAGEDGLRIFSLATPTNPTLLGALSGFPMQSVSVVNQRAYVTWGGLYVIDVSTPSSPQWLDGHVALSDSPSYAYAVGTTVYVANRDIGLAVVDASDPTWLRMIKHTYMGGEIWDMDVVGNLAYIGTNNGLQIVDISDPKHPRLRSGFGRDVLGVKVVGDRAYLSIVPFDTYDQPFQGLQVVDVHNPDQPVLLGSIVRDNMPWRMDVAGTRVYLGTISGFEILDVSDPTAIRSIKQESVSIVDEVVVAGDRVYMAGDVGVVVSDLDGEWIHYYSLGQSCDGALGIDVAGELIYVASECGLVIMRWGEIEGEPSLVELGRLPMRATAVRVAGAVALVSENIGMQLITTVDISDPAHPVVRDQLPSPTWATELEVRNDLLFMPSLSDGVQIFRLPLQFTYLPFARQQ